MSHQTAAGGGRVILTQEQWHGLISTGISECMDSNMKNQEEKRSKWRKVGIAAGLEVKQAIQTWKKLRHLARQAAIAGPAGQCVHCCFHHHLTNIFNITVNTAWIIISNAIPF